MSVTNGKPGISRVADDDLLGIARPMPAKVDAGEYSGVFVRAERGRYERRPRWFLWFAINTQCPYVGVELYLCCPFPEEGNVFGLGSKLVAAYTIAIGAPPRRRDRISKEVFRNKTFRFLVRTVSKDKDGHDRPADYHYSVIDRLLAIETGRVSK